MGADSFYHTARGATAKEAFAKARADAQFQHGHGGYTGTIAEKTTFEVIEVPADFVPPDRTRYDAVTRTRVPVVYDPADDPLGDTRRTAYAEHLMQAEDPRIDDKWGPAGAILLKEDNWLFFGYASS